MSIGKNYALLKKVVFFIGFLIVIFVFRDLLARIFFLKIKYIPSHAISISVNLTILFTLATNAVKYICIRIPFMLTYLCPLFEVVSLFLVGFTCNGNTTGFPFCPILQNVQYPGHSLHFLILNQYTAGLLRGTLKG